jgi:hypothetical protein
MDHASADPVVTARTLVAERFPETRAAFLAGSATTSARTSTSDLDVVVVLPEDDPTAPFRETTRCAGWLVELFVHTPASLRHYREAERERNRPVLDLMCALGHPLLGPECDEVAAGARAALANGPVLDGRERERRRYVLTDLLDDLRGTTGHVDAATTADRAFVSARLLEETTHLALLLRGEWAHTGKAAARALSALDPDLLERLVAATVSSLQGRPGALDAVVSEVLLDAGGPLREGYAAAGERLAAHPDRSGDGLDDEAGVSGSR